MSGAPEYRVRPWQIAAGLFHHVGIDAPGFPVPAIRDLHLGHGRDEAEAVETLLKFAKLVQVGRVLGPAVRGEQGHGARPVRFRFAPQHAHERRDADPAGDHYNGAVGIVVQAHRSFRAHDPHRRAGRCVLQRLLVGALAHAGGDCQQVLVRRVDERESALAVIARAWKILRQKKVNRFTRREREPVRLFEMKGDRGAGDLLAAQQLAVVLAMLTAPSWEPIQLTPLSQRRSRRARLHHLAV